MKKTILDKEEKDILKLMIVGNGNPSRSEKGIRNASGVCPEHPAERQKNSKDLDQVQAIAAQEEIP